MGNVRAVIVIKIVIGSTNEKECKLKQSRRSTMAVLGPCGPWGGGFEIRIRGVLNFTENLHGSIYGRD